MKHIILILLFPLFPINSFCQFEINYLENNIEYLNRFNGYYYKYNNNVNIFFCIEEKELIEEIAKIINSTLNRSINYIDPSKKYNFIIYENFKLFNNSNNFQEINFKNYQKNYKTNAKSNTISILIEDLNIENIKILVENSILLNNIIESSNYTTNEIINNNKIFIQAYLFSNILSDSTKFISYKEDLKTNIKNYNTITSREIKNNEEFLAMFLHEYKTKYGWYKHFLLSKKNYSKYTYEYCFKQVYGDDLDTAINNWIKINNDLQLSNNSSLHNETPNMNLSNLYHGLKKDYYRFNGLIDTFYVINRNFLILPYKKYFKLYNISTEIQYNAKVENIFYKNNITNFFNLNDNYLIIINLHSLDIYNKKTKKTKNIINNLQKYELGKILDVLCKLEENIVEISILSELNKSLSLTILHYNLGNNKLNKEIITNKFKYEPDNNLEYTIFTQTDSLYLVKINKYINDTTAINYLIDNKNNEDTTLNLNKNIDSSKLENEKDKKSEIINKRQYSKISETNSKFELKKYNFYLKSSSNINPISIEDNINYYPLFETNGAYMNINPSAGTNLLINDIYNDNSFILGLKIPINIEGSEISMKYFNLRNRFNWNIGYSRIVRYINLSNKIQTDKNNNIIPGQRKLINNKLSYTINYPLRNFWNLRNMTEINYFNTIFQSLDEFSLNYNDTQNYLISSTFSLIRTNFNQYSKYITKIDFITLANKNTRNSHDLINILSMSLTQNYIIKKHNISNYINAQTNLSKKKNIFNIGGTNGEIAPPISNNNIIYDENEYKFQNYIRNQRGVMINNILANKFILNNFEYFYNFEIANNYKKTININNIHLGIFNDNLVYYSVNNYIGYKFSLGPIIKFNINSKTNVKLGIDVISKEKLWFISLNNFY